MIREGKQIRHNNCHRYMVNSVNRSFSTAFILHETRDQKKISMTIQKKCN